MLKQYISILEWKVEAKSKHNYFKKRISCKDKLYPSGNRTTGFLMKVKYMWTLNCKKIFLVCNSLEQNREKMRQIARIAL